MEEKLKISVHKGLIFLSVFLTAMKVDPRDHCRQVPEWDPIVLLLP
jgi:hypothetical protein